MLGPGGPWGRGQGAVAVNLEAVDTAGQGRGAPARLSSDTPAGTGPIWGSPPGWSREAPALQTGGPPAPAWMSGGASAAAEQGAAAPAR